MGIRKPARNPSTLLVTPTISYRTLVGLAGGFVPWENLSNLLKDICRPTKLHWHVQVKVD